MQPTPPEFDPYDQNSQPGQYGPVDPNQYPPPASDPNQYPPSAPTPGQYVPPGQYGQPGYGQFQPGYGQPGYGQFASTPPTSNYAIAAMVTAIMSTIISCCFFPLYFVGSAIGLLWLVPKARKEIAAGKRGAGMVTAAVVLSWIGIAIGALLTFLYVVGVTLGGS